MNIRQEQENLEIERLSKYATLSVNTKGRVLNEQKCNIRTDFQRDRDRILHSKAFRRLAHKTQVFISPEGDHYRTRLTHTLEVAQIARTMARGLSLNEDLTEAIALGHDLGHTPFGHAGEDVLREITNNQFAHNEQGLRVVDYLENDGKGLNLTYEVRDGILNHRTKGLPSTLEGKIVQHADKIAYLNHDIDDAIRGNLMTKEDIPFHITNTLGDTFGHRINTLTTDIIVNSLNKNDIVMSQDIEKAYKDLRKFLFQKIYIDSDAKLQEDKAKNIIKQLYDYYMNNTDKLSDVFYINDDSNKEKLVCDYIAGMTDRYAVKLYSKLYLPLSWDIY